MSDGTEKTAEGPVLHSDLFAGETYDARREIERWDCDDFDDSDWLSVKTEKANYSILAAQIGAPVEIYKELEAVKAYVSPKGENIIDFGQVIAGRVRFKVNLPKDKSITLEHFEITDLEGNYFNNILGAGGVGEGCDQKVVYISNGKEATYEAMFSFQGFRFVKVTGIDELNAKDFVAVALSTRKEDLGTFECSDSRLNRLYENTRWSQRANMISIPTDCPQREKAGWTGDIGLYATTSLLNEDTTGLLTRWLKSVSNDQSEDGAVPMVVPYNQTYKSLEFLLKLTSGSKGSVGVAGWGDASILVPLAMYEQTGNTEILKNQYDCMKLWCDYIITTAKNNRGDKKIDKNVEQYLWNTGFHYGEWLIPSCSSKGMSDVAGMKETMSQGKKYIPEIYGYLAMNHMTQIATLLERKSDAEHYADMAQKMKHAFETAVITSKGEMPVDVMGAYIIPLHYGLVPENLQEKFKNIIIKKIEDNDGCLDTGFLGTPVILDTLCGIGRTDMAYDLLFQTKCPSWLYEVEHGATTIWESWYTKNANGSPMAVSLNHYAFGCVDDWMFRTITGICSEAPGYKKILINPILDERINYASRSYETEYGKVSVNWEKEANEFTMNVEIPCNTTARIVLPDGSMQEVGSGKYSFHVA